MIKKLQTAFTMPTRFALIYTIDLLFASLFSFLSFLLFVFFGALFEINFKNVYTPMYCFIFLFWLYATFANKKK